MTEQSSDAAPEISVGDPQSLEFQLIADDGQVAVYEALIVDCKTPGSPVLGLTVTVASSIQRVPEKHFDKFLSGMKAAFVVLSEVPPDDGGPDVDQPFDSSAVIDIGFRLASFTGPKPVGIALTVVTTAGLVPAPAEGDTGNDRPVGIPLPHHIPAGLSDRWHSNSKSSFTAYVTPSIGNGTLSSAGKGPIDLKTHQTSSMSGTVVVVTASPKTAMTYSFTGSGHL
jgi:hypothetical protein